jgi:hypothetical protein
MFFSFFGDFFIFSAAVFRFYGPDYKGSPGQHANLDDFDLEIDAGEDAQMIAALTRRLSRPEMMGIDGESSGQGGYP